MDILPPVPDTGREKLTAFALTSQGDRPDRIKHRMDTGVDDQTFPHGDREIVLLVDADACPVKDEVYRVAQRHDLRVAIVANAPIAVPKAEWIVRVTVGQGLDVADDWIAARARPGAIVITADIPLAARCVRAGASVIAPNGKIHTDASIGATLATRNLMDSLRSAGEITGGPRPFAPRDRSAFLSALDLAIQRLKRGGVKTGQRT